MPDLANGQWHRSAMAPAGSSPVVGAASHSIDALSFSAFARGGLSMDSENKRGVTLALVSSIFIGTSFIIKKKGLMMAGQTGLRASAGGYSYLLQPLWWVGMATMIGGEFANLAAYAYAPAIVVTPLGASTIIISAILANCFLGETMHLCGVFACMLTVVGSAILVRCAEAPSTRHLSLVPSLPPADRPLVCRPPRSYAPEEAPLSSVEEIWGLATQPQFLCYCAGVVATAFLLIYRCAPRYGRTHLLVYVLICSLIGSLSVVSCKALGIALKLTLRGSNQLFKRETLAFAITVLCCVLIQMKCDTRPATRPLLALLAPLATRRARCLRSARIPQKALCRRSV